MTAAVFARTALSVTGRGLLPAVGLGGSVRVPMFVGEVAVTACGHAIPLAALVTACGYFCQWREDDEPGVSNRRVWRLWLSPRLLLSLDRLLQSPPLVGRTVAAFPPAVQDLARFFLNLAGFAYQGVVAGLAGTFVPASGGGFYCALPLQV